jgi:hypothetical protein
MLSNKNIYTYLYETDPKHYLNVSHAYAIPEKFLIPMDRKNNSSFAKKKFKEIEKY